jgi:hypothetical protein
MSGIIGGAGSKSGVIGETEIEYEEGTWSASVTGSSNVSGSPSVADPKYVKIGKNVQLWFRVHSTGANLFDSSTAEAMWKIGGIPFLKSSSSFYDSGVATGWVGGGSSRVTMGAVLNGGGENDAIWVYVSANEMESRTQASLYCHCSYISA